MSKRSSRRKRKLQQKKQAARQTGPILTRDGKLAFQQQDYHKAIDLWEQARHKPNLPTTFPAALAEAYFRRAMLEPSPGVSDLQRAVKLHPQDPRYAYHLALARHRAGELDQAETIYRQLLAHSAPSAGQAQSPPYQRAAVPLAQLLIERGKNLSKDPMWGQLKADEKLQMAAAQSLVKKKAPATMQRLAEKPLDPLWRGLIALALKDRTTAWQSLENLTKANTLSDLPVGVAHYYLGTLAAEAEQYPEALTHWQKAQSKGLTSQHLHQNLTSLAHQLAIEAQQTGGPERAVELLEQYCSPKLLHQSKLGQHLNLEMAYQSAQKGDWETALHRWQTAENRGDDSRRLAFNLALAYQNVEQHREAAEHWRSVLRRRTKRADHPDALNDKQVARIWQSVAENYSKAGDYEEAVKTYKNAVKWAPDNLDLRLKLVDAYQTEGRWRAAKNEIKRILDKNPDHVPTLILLAENHSNDYFPEQAREIWQRILELEPNNPVARPQLAYTYEKQGYSLARWGNTQAAIGVFEEGLKYIPNSQRLLILIGNAYADEEDYEQVRDYLEQARAINPNDLSTLHTIYRIWLEAGSSADLHQTFEHIKAITSSVPGSFFLDLIEMCDKSKRPKESQQLLEYVEKHYPDDDKVQVGVALIYLNLDQKSKGASILRAILKKNPRNPMANLHLGIIYFEIGQTRLAKRHWSKAESQARKENDFPLLHHIQVVKDELLYDIPSNPMDMLMNLPDGMLDELLEDAPPEIVEAFRKKDRNLLELMMRMGAMGDFDDDDDEDFYL